MVGNQRITSPLNTRFRRSLLLLLIGGTLGIAIELILLGHFEDWEQWVPLALLGTGLVSTVWIWSSPASRAALRSLLAVAWLQIAGGMLGLYFHLQSNAEFELEMRPNQPVSELVVETLTGAVPAVAPGALAFLGMLAILVAGLHRNRSSNH